MGYSDLLDEFHGQRVVDFQDVSSWEGPDVTYRLREEYDDEVKIADRLNALLQQPEANQLTALIIGAWTGAQEGSGAAEIVEELAKAASRLASLRRVFMGDITFEECEISWINQTDMSPLLKAYPKLEVLRVRGANSLEFSPIRHESLQELAIESGGLSGATIRQVFQADLPELRHLELLLGEANYGFDCGVEALQPLFTGRLFPKLKFLGLMNSEIADDIAAVIVNSPIVERIETLDLSMGNLGDEGFRSLHGLAECKQLLTLNVSHHYASPESVAALQAAVPCTVIADDPQEPDDEWRPIIHAE